MYKILDNLGPHGIAYDNDRYPISKDSISEQEILSSSEKIDEDGNKWFIIDARILSDYEVNDIDDYLALIDAASHALDQNHSVVICCGAGISRSNAIALGVLMKHFHMDFYDAVDLIEEKVPICNIDPLHITVLKKIFNLTLP
jgi:protein-tyrosine phosphatase